jgi:4-hydroxy-3-polyprenylbenzoate decarboxylase
MPKYVVSRRQLVATGSLGLAATLAAGSGSLAATLPAAGPGKSRKTGAAPLGPFDSCRDMIAALEARGRLLRIPEADQDAYEATALMYRLVDRHGLEGAPALLFEKVRIDGTWRQGPVIGNYLGHWDAEALVFGLAPDPADGPATFRRAKEHLMALAAANGGRYPQIPPVEVPRERAPCKEVTLTGDAIDLTVFPFMQVNPGDGGRYINTASVFTADPKAGVNLGTYRCQLKGPRKVAVSPGEGQTGWNQLTAARKRGDRIARVTLVLGQDPIVYVVSGTRVANRQGDKPVDELAVAGGLRGKPVEVVRCETNEFLVPAHAEMIIEGEVPLDTVEPEGPYGEGLGYQGQGEEAFLMNVTAVTHRRNPWFHNSFTGVDRGPISSPGVASATLFAKKFAPEVVDFHYRSDAKNLFFASIDKTAPGQGLAVGEKLCKFNPVAKVMVVVDKDVDLMNTGGVIAAISSRWQPFPAARIYDSLPGLPLDPSQPTRMKTSKIVIDATRQLPGEGGPATYPRTNRSILVAEAPDAFARVDAKWAELIDKAG